MLKLVVLCSVVAAATSNLISPIGGVASIAGISPLASISPLAGISTVAGVSPLAGISPLVGISPLAGVAPLSGLSPIAPVGPLALSAPLLAPNNNYRGPLSLAPGQPANIIAADGRPLDTLDVNLDRSAHLTARALEGGRKKRSAPLVAPLSPLAPVVVGNPLIARTTLASVAPLSPIAPIGPIAPISPLGLSAPLLSANLYRSPIVTPLINPVLVG